MNIIARISRITIVPEGDPLFSERATHVSIANEAAGEFVEIEQQVDSREAKYQTITIDPDEWPIFRDTIERMLKDIRANEPAKKGGE